MSKPGHAPSGQGSVGQGKARPSRLGCAFVGKGGAQGGLRGCQGHEGERLSKPGQPGPSGVLEGLEHAGDLVIRSAAQEGPGDGKDLIPVGGRQCAAGDVVEGRVGGGLGVAPIYPQARGFKEAGAYSNGQVVQEVGGGIEGLAAGALPDRYLAKGTYFRLAAGPAPCSRLVYPLPVDGGLGVHLTLDLAGNARFGPDVQWIDDPDVQWIDGLDYTVNVDRVPEFVAAIERYWPAVTERELVADYAGIRPKLGGPGSPAADFRISTPADHGVPGLINLFGIESPGLTSSLAIAELVGAQIAAQLGVSVTTVKRYLTRAGALCYFALDIG